jgi:hypothetical protein
MQTEMDDGKREIIRRFNENVRNKKADSSTANKRHDGKDGHWLETQMGVEHNHKTEPDLFGYEMKNKTTSKTTFGDWSADEYIFQKWKKEWGITGTQTAIRDEYFLPVFGKPNENKNGRFSWSGTPFPKVNILNSFGQIMVVDSNGVRAIYHFSKDTRLNKFDIVPTELQVDNLILARWDRASIQKKLEDKFNQKGWFKCETDNNGVYNSIVFGDPINFENWIRLVNTGDVFLDNGMYQGNSRPYATWRSNNSLWEKLITSRY